MIKCDSDYYKFTVVPVTASILALFGFIVPLNIFIPLRRAFKNQKLMSIQF